MTCLRIGVWTFVLLTVPVTVDAQMRAVVQARVEWGGVASGGFGLEEVRRGISMLAGADGSGASMRVAITHVPEGDVEPGWNAVIVELGPAVTVHDMVLLSARVAGGGYQTDVDNRHEVIRGCRQEEGCMFEARSFESGWAVLGGAAVEGSLTLIGGLGFTAGYRWARLLKGANADERRNSWSVGATYTFR